MQAVHKTLLQRWTPVVTTCHRSFSVTYSDLQKEDSKLKKKLNMLKLMTQDRDFTYEPPEMIYDKSTGDVQILPKKIKKKNTIVQNFDDVKKEKAALLKELGVPDGNLDNVDLTTDMNATAEKIYSAHKTLDDDMDFDPTKFYVFARDLMRIDVGLMIMRPPIFMHMRDPDIEMMKLRSEVMNEYYCDFKKYVKEYAEVTQLNESIFAENPYASTTNLDNHPTHAMNDPQTGERLEYCGASKNFAKVDPTCSDPRSIHYAAEDRTYFIVRNKYTGEWQFPTGQIYFGHTLLRAKQNLFMDLSAGSWAIKYSGNMPQIHTLREFTVAEKEEVKNEHLKGVRTYFFHANHRRGLANLVVDSEKTDYDDHAWVPKRKMNEWFNRDYYEIFVHGCTTR